MAKDFKIHAVLCLSNNGGVALMVNDTGEAVRWQWYDDKPTARWQQIKYKKNGEPYVIIHGRRFYLGEFLKV